MKFPTTKLLIVLALFALVKNDQNEGIPDYPKLKVQYGNHTINRPLFHFTPEFGWMNDPNGCWFDKTDKVYHIYFQYNPNDTIWGMPLYWGHATSEDLITWKEEKIAIRAPDWAGAYSGSMFIDDDCIAAAGWFSGEKCNEDNKNKNTIAAWTWNDKDWYEHQCLSYSTDGGKTFVTPEDHYCPLIDETEIVGEGAEQKEVSSKQFRDPQVVKFGSNQYIMSIAKSHEYSIHFYESTDLAQWKIAGGFTLYGYLGFQYECPNLIKLNNESPENGEDPYYWVLFISINPGSQQGGSSTEYFFGNYTFGTAEGVDPYEAKFFYNTLIDQGKDFYAMQIMYVPPTPDEIKDGFDTGIGITWASNWQYTKVVPTDPWRSSMAIPRRIKLGHYNPTGTTPLLYVLSKALLDADDMDDSKLTEPTRFDEELPDFTSISSGQNYKIRGTAFGALELYIEFISCDAYTDHAPGVITFFLRGGSIPEEYLRIGYNQKADAFFLDRGNTNVQWVHDNPFFTDKLTMTVYGSAVEDGEQSGIFKSIFNTETKKYSIAYTGTCDEVKFTAHIIVDRNIVEIFFNEDDKGYSAITSTNTFFFSGGNFITDVLVDYNSGQTNTDKIVGFRDIKIKGRHLNLKESSSSNTPESPDTPDDTNP